MDEIKMENIILLVSLMIAGTILASKLLTFILY